MIVIAGAGIGGLTLGCALARMGRPFAIFERAPELRPAGAGIALSQNAFAALAHLGLDSAARAAGQEISDGDHLRPDGRVLIARSGAATRAPAARWPWPAPTCRRCCWRRWAPPVHTGRAVRTYRARPGGLLVELDDGIEVKADLLVGADGLHSTVRRGHARRPSRCATPATPAGARWSTASTCPPEAHRELGPRPALRHRPDRPPPGLLVRGRRRARRRHRRRRPAPRSAGPLRRLARAHRAADRRRRPRPHPAHRHPRPPAHRQLDRGSGRAPRRRRPPDDPQPRPGRLPGDRGRRGARRAPSPRPPTSPAPCCRYQQRRLARANSFVVRSWRFGQIAHLRTRPLRWLRNQALRAIPPAVTARAATRDLHFEL